MAEEPKKKVKLKVSGARSTKAAAEDAAADRESMGQVRKSLVFLAFVVVAYVAYLVFSGQFDEFVTSLAGVDLGWVTAGVVCFLFYYVFGVLAYVLSVIADPDSPVGIRDLMSVEASGVFFMRLTPNGAAAPPAQIYRLTRAGLSVGQASALNFTRFVLYEAGEGVFAAIMLLFCGNYFYEQFGDVTIIGLFLFGFKVVQVGAVLFLCLFPSLSWPLATGPCALPTAMAGSLRRSSTSTTRWSTPRSWSLPLPSALPAETLARCLLPRWSRYCSSAACTPCRSLC